MHPDIQIFTLNPETKVRIFFKEDQLSDIQIKMSKKKRHDFLKNYDDRSRHWKTSSNTYLFQSELIKYRRKKIQTSKPEGERINDLIDKLLSLSEDYAGLEVFINNFVPTNQTEILKQLNFRIDELKIKIQEKLNGKLSEKTINELKNRLSIFQKKIETTDELKQLFYAKNLRKNIPSLGVVIAKQYSILLSSSLKKAYEITDNQLTQAFQMHPGIKALSEAKALIGIKNFSLYGARSANTHSPIPDTMLEIIQPLKNEQNLEIRWFSLMPFLNSPDNIEQLDEMLCYFNQGDVKTQIAWYYTPLRVIAIMIELIVFFPLRFLSSTISFIASCCGRLIGLITFDTFTFSTKKWDETVSNIHHTFSPVRFVMRHAALNYQKKIQKSTSERKEILAFLGEKSRSLYNDIITHFFSGHLLAESFSASIKYLISSIKNPFSDTSYILSTTQIKRDANFEKIKNNTENILNKEYSSFFFPSNENECIDVFEKEEALWLNISKWQPNQFSSFLDFPDDIAYGLSEIVMGPMFRTSPGFSTVYFMLSQASLAVLFFPFLKTTLGLTGKILQTVPSWLSHHLTGTSINESYAKKIISVFIMWKILFFTSEFTNELVSGNFEILNDIFQSSEKIILYATFFISIGYLLQFIPNIPSPAGNIINFFSTQSQDCTHATIPLNSLEYAFLGLKFSLLIHSTLSGKQKISSDKIIDQEKIQKVFKSLNLFECNLSHSVLKEKIKPIFHQYITKDIDEKTQSSAIDEFIQTLNTIKQTRLNNILNEHSSANTILIKNMELQKTLRLILQREMMGKAFDPNHQRKEARLFFDRLNDLFKEYHEALKSEGLSDQFIDSDELLHHFYNKHCYHGSNNLLRIVTIVFFPIAYFWRALKYLIAGTTRFHSPSIQHQVKMSFAKDRAIIFQSIAFCSRVIYVLARAYSYTLRVLFIASVFALTLSSIFWFQRSRNMVFECASRICLHHLTLTKSFHSWYTKSAHIANITHDDLFRQTINILTELTQHTLTATESTTSSAQLFPTKQRDKILPLSENTMNIEYTCLKPKVI